MVLNYAFTFECDSCGAVAQVEPPAAVATVTKGPVPDGWSVNELVFGSVLGATVRARDFCPTCMAMPAGELVQRMKEKP